MTHATTHATHVPLSEEVPSPPSEEKSVTEKWGKYDVLNSLCANAAVSACGCRFADTRISLVVNPYLQQTKCALQSNEDLFLR